MARAGGSSRLAGAALADFAARAVGVAGKKLLNIGGRRLPAVFFMCAMAAALASGAHGGDTGSSLAEHRQAVVNGELDGTARRDAAAALLEARSAAADEALVAMLTGTPDAGARRAILSALRTSTRQPPPALLAPVLNLLPVVDDMLLDDAAAVLGRFDAAAAVPKLADLTANRRSAPQARRGAAMALGYFRTQAAAEALMQATHPRQPPDLRATAFRSLARLAGLDEYGQDYRRWVAWWQQHGPLPAAQWQQHLVDNFARRAADLSRRHTQIQDRLLLALRQRYRAAPAEQRQQVLAGMLADPLDSVRGLALELTREVLIARPIEPVLQRAVMAKLDDEAARIRADAALLLRDMRHSAAADIVAARLAQEEESNPEVVRAYLLMMHRLPHPVAVEPALRLLADATHQAEAAGVLIAALDHQPPLIDSAQLARTATLLRRQIRDDELPPPRLIELLGRVGDDDDWRRIAGWIRSDDSRVKEAAARAWVESGRSLLLLAEHAGDEIVQAFVIPAAIQRANRPETLLALVKYPPGSEVMFEQWGRALVALAGRVDPKSVVAAYASLAKSSASADLKLQFLSACLDKHLPAEPATPQADPPQDPQALADLLLARAEVRLAEGDAKSAEADLDRIEALKVTLDDAARRRRSVARITAKFMAGDLDAALARAAPAIRPPAPPQSPDTALQRQVTDLMLSFADRFIASRQSAKGIQVLASLRQSWGAVMPADVEERVRLLESRAAAAGDSTG